MDEEGHFFNVVGSLDERELFLLIVLVAVLKVGQEAYCAGARV